MTQYYLSPDSFADDLLKTNAFTKGYFRNILTTTGRVKRTLLSSFLMYYMSSYGDLCVRIPFVFWEVLFSFDLPYRSCSVNVFRQICLMQESHQLVVAMMMTDCCLKKTKRSFLLSCCLVQKKCMAVLRRSVGFEWLIELCSYRMVCNGGVNDHVA